MLACWEGGRVRDSSPGIQHALQRRTDEQSGSSRRKRSSTLGRGAAQPEGRKVRRHELEGAKRVKNEPAT